MAYQTNKHTGRLKPIRGGHRRVEPVAGSRVQPLKKKNHIVIEVTAFKIEPDQESIKI